MNLSTMFNMLQYLTKHKKSSAKELAEVFEINQRSVYRYINHMSVIGVPVETQIGRSGGIFLSDKYCIDKSVFTEAELQTLKNLLTKDNSEISNSILQKLNLL